MKKALFILVLVLAILVLPATNTIAAKRAVSSDYIGHWAEVQIKEFISKKFITGYPDGSIRPDREISRAEFVILVNKVFGYKDKHNSPVENTNKSEWYSEEVLKAVNAGYVSTAKDFKADSTINRIEAAEVLAILLKWDKSIVPESKLQFKDTEAIPEQNRAAFYTAVNKGYFIGSTDNWLQPNRNLTRAEAIVLLYKAGVGEVDKGVLPVSPAEKEIKGVLFTSCCKQKSPEKETKACLSMPDCAENGYGVNVKQTDGSYRFLPFDSYGNELAKSQLLPNTKKSANITIVVKAVEGVYPDRILKVLSVSEKDEASKAEQVIEGVLIDKHCFQYGEPETDSVECLKMKACEASGYGVAVKQSNGKYIFYQFDDKGHKIAKKILQSTSKENNIVVIAKGEVAGDIIQISELTEK